MTRVIQDPAPTLCAVLMEASPVLWELPEVFLEAVVPELNPKGKIVVGQAGRLRRAVPTEGAVKSEAGVRVALQENLSLSSG